MKMPTHLLVENPLLILHFLPHKLVFFILLLPFCRIMSQRLIDTEVSAFGGSLEMGINKLIRA